MVSKALILMVLLQTALFCVYDGVSGETPFTPSPVLSLDRVEDNDGTAALYVTYTGGDSSKKRFYYKDSLQGDTYKLLPVMWGAGADDAVGIVTDERIDRIAGHIMKLKVYFRASAAERDVYIMVINEKGDPEAPAVHYKLSALAPLPVIRPAARPRPAVRQPSNVRDDVRSMYGEIASRTGGELILSESPKDVPDKVLDVVNRTAGGDIDFVFVIDDTGSMMDDVAELRARMDGILATLYEKHTKVRLGLVLYRDYGAEFVTKPFPMTESRNTFQRNLSTMKTTGGGDEPEAVLEGIEAALTANTFTLAKRVILVLGDAPGHESSRGKMNDIVAKAKLNAITVKIFALAIAGLEPQVKNKK